MVFDTATLIPKAQGIIGNTLSMAWYVALGFILLILLAVAFVFFYYRKRWNMTAIFLLTRNDGRLTIAEIGKAFYNAKKGVVFIKRPNMGRFSKGLAVKIIDIRRYLLSGDVIFFQQVGPEDYRPVLIDSWTENVVTYKDDVTGDLKQVKESILNIKVDSGLNKAWKTAWDSAAKNAYSIRSMLSQFQTPIAIGIVIICCFIGFAILWTKVH
jgi:hypothetical protein